jgi:hypothetical protein
LFDCYDLLFLLEGEEGDQRHPKPWPWLWKEGGGEEQCTCGFIFRREEEIQR